MEQDLKRQFGALCDELGVSMTTAFNIFAIAMVRKRGFPFDVNLEGLNGEADEKMRELADDRVNAAKSLFGILPKEADPEEAKEDRLK